MSEEQDRCDGGTGTANATRYLNGMTVPTELRANAPVFKPRFDLALPAVSDGGSTRCNNEQIENNVLQKDGNHRASASGSSEHSNRRKKNLNSTRKRDRESGRGKGKGKNTKFEATRTHQNQDNNSNALNKSKSKQKASGKRLQRNRNRRRSRRNLLPEQNRDSTLEKSSPYDEEEALLYHQHTNLSATSSLHHAETNAFPALGNPVHNESETTPSVWNSTSSGHQIFQPLKEQGPSSTNNVIELDEFARLGLQRLSPSSKKKIEPGVSSTNQTNRKPLSSGLSLQTQQTKDLGDATVVDDLNEEKLSDANNKQIPPYPSFQKPKWNMNRLRDRWWRTLALQRLHQGLMEELKLHFVGQGIHENDSETSDNSDSESYLEPVEIGSSIDHHSLPKNELGVHSTIADESWVQSLDGSISSQTEGVLNAIAMNDERALDAILLRNRPNTDRTAEEIQDPAFRSVSEKALFRCVEDDKPHLLRIVMRHLSISVNPRRMKKQEATEAHQVSPLMKAAYLGHSQCLAILLSNEERHTSTLLFRDLDGNNVFHYCCRGQGDGGSLRTLLKEVSSGSKWKQQILSKLLLLRNKTGKTSLHIACEDGKEELVQSFLSLCSSSLLSKMLSITDMSNQTPLLAAVASNRTEVVTSLIMWRGNKNRNLWQKVSQIPNNGDTETKNSGLKEKGQESSRTPPCALVWAAKNGVIDMIHVLLQFSSVSGGEYRVTEALAALIESTTSDEDKSESARMLILAGGSAFADVSPIHSDSSSSTAAKVETPISLASKNGATQILQTIVQVGKHELKAKQQLRRRDPKLQQQPESFFRAIEAAENAQVKSALTNALIESLFYGWYHRETSLGFQHTSSATTLYRLGAQLGENDIDRLWKSMEGNGILQLDARSTTTDGDQSRCFMTSYVHSILDPNSKSRSVSDIDRTQLSGYSRTLCGFRWVKDQVSAFGCNCPWITREKDKGFTAENDKVCLVVRNGERFVAHASIVSHKSQKLASAIRFSTMNDDANSAERIIPEIFVDMDGRMIRYMLQHMYHGSVFTGWPTNDGEIFRDLLDLMVVAEEALCPSLVQECEMRLLSSKPTRCFCWSCCKAVRPSLENSQHAAECLYFVEGPGTLITGSHSLDVLAITEFVSGLPLEYSICVAPLPYSNTSYIPASAAWKKVEKTWKATRAIQLLKDQAIMTILLRFSEVIESASYQESVQYNADPTSSSDLHQMLLLRTCLDEFHQSSLLCERNTIRKFATLS